MFDHPSPRSAPSATQQLYLLPETGEVLPEAAIRRRSPRGFLPMNWRPIPAGMTAWRWVAEVPGLCRPLVWPVEWSVIDWTDSNEYGLGYAAGWKQIWP